MALPADPEKVIKKLRADLNDLRTRCKKVDERNLHLEERAKLLAGELAALRKGIDISADAKEIKVKLEQKEDVQLEIF